MREIKFRGKRLKSDTWIYGSLFNSIWRKSADGSRVCYIFPDNMLDDDNGGGDCWEDFAKVAEQYEVDPATVGQYTGLKDKNGKEIYEGDIIECIGSDNKPIRHLVRYNDEKGGYSQLLFMGNGLACEPYDGGLISQNYICEMGKYIIGNIHDNPELLKTE